MKKRQCCAGALAAASALALLAGASASAQTVIPVNDGRTLTEDDLLAGMFGGQTFTLSPDLRFEINAGGAINLLLDETVFGSMIPFDFAGSTVNVNTGGRFESFSNRTRSVSDVLLNVFAGGEVGDGLIVREHSLVNIRGGLVGSDLRALQGSLVDIRAGRVGDRFDAGSGSVVNIAGGSVGAHFEAFDGSVVNITGGGLGRSFKAREGSVINISGDEFRTQDGFFTGALADGSVFIFTDLVDDVFAAGSQRLTTVRLPDADLTPMVVSTGAGPNGLRAGQTLTLAGNATLRDNFAAVGATLNIDGGVVGNGLETLSSVVHITDGNVGDRFDAFSGSVVSITGGSVGNRFIAFPNTEINISGGSVGDGFQAHVDTQVSVSGGIVGRGLQLLPGAQASISGGHIGERFTASADTLVNISGGSFGSRFRALDRSVVNIAGSEFRLDNAPAVPGFADGLPQGGVFTGALADGTAFIFTDLAGDFFSPGAVRLESVALPPADATPMVVATGEGPTKGLRPGQTLTLTGNGLLRDHFSVVDATLNIAGGSVGAGLETAFSQVNITGGAIEREFDAFAGSVVNINGGSVGDFFDAHPGAEVNISGGDVGGFFTARQGSVVNISGGSVGNSFNAQLGSAVSISGGSLGNFHAETGSAVSITGGEFLLDGAPVVDLPNGVMSGAALTGTLADGTVFIVASGAGDLLAPSTTTLKPIALPPADTTPIVVSTGEGPTKGLRAGQALTITGDATLRDNFAAVGATLNIDGGAVGDRIETAFTNVNITDGTVGDSFGALLGSQVHITGGAVGNFFTALAGSEIHIDGGSVGHSFRASESEVTITGGTVGNLLRISNDSVLDISGGAVGANLHASSTDVNITGGSIGDSLNVFGASTVTIAGGSVGDFFHALDASEINITGGSIGDSFQASLDAKVNISGGSVGNSFDVMASEVTITGGTVGDFLRIRDDSVFNISGGIVGDALSAHDGGVINISGSAVAGSLRAFSNSDVNLFVLELLIDGQPLDLTFGETVLITQRGGALLEATLADGSFLDFTLNDAFIADSDFFHTNATLTATRVPGPGVAALLSSAGAVALRRRRSS